MKTSYCRLAVMTGMVLLAGCSSVPKKSMSPADLAAIPDAVPKVEQRSDSGNPEYYDQSGRRYWILSTPFGYAAKGKASWYGGKFHGRRTSSGETYDMYAMTAAHKTLPIPCYARVTNLENGRSVVVKINDRGPFVDGRIVDLSYVAASKLGMVEKGIANVELRVIDPRRPAPLGTRYAQTPTKAVPPAPAPEVVSSIPEKPATKMAQSQPAPVVQAMSPVSGVIVPKAQPAKPIAKKPVAKPVSNSVVDSNVVQPAVQPQPAVIVPPLPKQEPVVSVMPQGVYVQLGAFSSIGNAETEKAKLQYLQTNGVQIETSTDSLGTLYRVLVGPLDSEVTALNVARKLQANGYDQYRIVQR